jgi:hypothetical protein
MAVIGARRFSNGDANLKITVWKLENVSIYKRFRVMKKIAPSRQD